MRGNWIDRRDFEVSHRGVDVEDADADALSYALIVFDAAVGSLPNGGVI